MKLLKRRLDYCWFVVFLASQLNRHEHKSLVFVPFQNSLLGLVFLLVPNSEYTMTLQVQQRVVLRERRVRYGIQVGYGAATHFMCSR